MDILQAIILGIVQGIGEFLPISSSGHLVIAGELLDLASGTKTPKSEKLLLNVTLHAGTLLSILVVYRSEIVKLRVQPRVCVLIILATIPAAFIGLMFKDFFEEVFATPVIAGFALLGTAVILVVAQKFERNEISYEELSPAKSLLIGVFQAGALIPGISRSGCTIAAGLICGMKREAAAAYSFLLAIPVIGGAALVHSLQVVSGSTAVSADTVIALVCGGVTAFIVGLVSLKCLVSLIARGKLHLFAYYCLTVGTLTVVWQLLSSVAEIGPGS